MNMYNLGVKLHVGDKNGLSPGYFLPANFNRIIDYRDSLFRDHGAAMPRVRNLLSSS